MWAWEARRGDRVGDDAKGAGMEQGYSSPYSRLGGLWASCAKHGLIHNYENAYGSGLAGIHHTMRAGVFTQFPPKVRINISWKMAFMHGSPGKQLPHFLRTATVYNRMYRLYIAQCTL